MRLWAPLTPGPDSWLPSAACACACACTCVYGHVCVRARPSFPPPVWLLCSEAGSAVEGCTGRDGGLGLLFQEGGVAGRGPRPLAVAEGPEPGAGLVSWASEGLGGHCEGPEENHLSSPCGDSGRAAASQHCSLCGSPWPRCQPRAVEEAPKLTTVGAVLMRNSGPWSSQDTVSALGGPVYGMVCERPPGSVPGSGLFVAGVRGVEDSVTLAAKPPCA